MFDGPAGHLVASIMARMNRQAELEAIEQLNPSPESRILVIGFGSGVGLKALAGRLPQGRILGVDPSAAMNASAARRCRTEMDSGRIRLVRSTAEHTGEPDASFDGAIAVNVLMLCNPISATARELSRVLKPGAELVSLTHDWALKRHSGSVASWLAATCAAFKHSGFVELRHFAAEAEKGASVAFIARNGVRHPEHHLQKDPESNQAP